jgi:dihydrofolate reductase
MAKLIYLAISSLDGYIADENGNFDWCAPPDEVHSFINDLSRPIGTHLYGRRMYDVMVAWETLDAAEQSRPMQDFAGIWRAADKIVFSKTLETALSAKTRIEREFNAATVGQMKASAESDLSVSGPNLAAHAFRAGLVDECLFFFAPVIVGGGKRSLPDDVFLNLELLDERRFESGFVHMHYRTLPGS